MENRENDISVFSSVETRRNALRVLFLEPQPCIRALKYAIALRRELGRDMSLWLGHVGHALSGLYGFGEEYFDKISVLDPERLGKSVRKLISRCKPQVIHSHNAPDVLTLEAIDASDYAPVIHDVHEVLSLHNSGFFKGDSEENMATYRKEEKKACEESDGRIYATEGIREYIQEQYSVDTQSSTVFYNYASGSVMPRYFRKELSAEDGETHIVYIGCVTSVVEGSHYDLREIFQRISDRKIHIHIYPTRNRITRSNRTYEKLADHNRFIHYHHHLDYKRLLHEITQYDFGWAGFNNVRNSRHVDIALQNKIFDYISSGLPVIAFRHKEIQRFIKKHGAGLIIKDVSELPELLETINIPELKERTLKARSNLTFESNIPRLLSFYDTVAEVAGD